MEHIIEVNGIDVYAYHGCLEEEAVVGNLYTVNVAISTDFSTATSSDNLSDTIDYVTVYNVVKEQMEIRSKLIEHVGKRIINTLKSKTDLIQSIEVKVIKHHPPVGGKVTNSAIIIRE